MQPREPCARRQGGLRGPTPQPDVRPASGQVKLNARVRAGMRHGWLLLLTCLFCLVPAAGASASVPFTTAAARDSEPVVLKGAQFGTWSVPANVTAKLPLTDLAC